MRKLLHKKGFTMVELIVVVALLGIMLAIVIPMLSTADARKNEVRDYARSFYSNVQELMVDERLANTPMPGIDPTKTKYILVCAQVNENGSTYDDVHIYMNYGDTIPSLTASTPVQLVDNDPGDPNNKLTLDLTNEAQKLYGNYEEFATSLRKLLLGNERSGAYFAIVDNKYRVVSTYFVEAVNTDETFDDLFIAVKNNSFGESNVVDGRYAGAWPEELSESGKNMFIEP